METSICTTLSQCNARSLLHRYNILLHNHFNPTSPIPDSQPPNSVLHLSDPNHFEESLRDNDYNPTTSNSPSISPSYYLPPSLSSLENFNISSQHQFYTALNTPVFSDSPNYWLSNPSSSYLESPNPTLMVNSNLLVDSLDSNLI